MDVITAIFHNFRPQAALRALLRLQSAVSPRRPHRGARDRERQGYASARMVRSRRLLLGLCLGWQAAACGPSEPGATDKPARSEALTEAEVDEPDLRALLRLDERSFPLTVWAAYIIQNEYFDKQRLDPRVQLVSALTYLGLHTPEFFAAVAGDQVTITVGSARQEFSLAGLDDLAVAADRLEMILGFAQAELKLEPEATHKLEYVAINGLLGLQLATDQRLATLPITTYVIGAALAALPAAIFMKHHGRRAGFMLGAAFGIAGALLSAFAVHAASFWLLCLGTVFAGIYNAFGQQYRFAAVDAAPADWSGKAISLTLAGGIVGGVIGPQVGVLTRDLLPPTYLASYLALAAFAALAMLIASRLEIPLPAVREQQAAGRPFTEIARQPAFIVAVLAAACGYATMNLLMTATPLAMDICGLPFADTAFVLQWHVIGMFAPSFVTGQLIKRYGVLSVLLVGAALLLLCIGIALSGVSLMHFWWALLLLGVGWNFLFVGGTALLIETCRPEEKAKAVSYTHLTLPTSDLV